MKHTKNILKSLLMTVTALSLLAVSCSKDEGGSKPTSPTPTKLEVAVETVEEVATAAEAEAAVALITAAAEKIKAAAQ